MSHIGIELRIRLPHLPEGKQTIVQATSDAMHLQAKYAGFLDTATGWHVLLPIVVAQDGVAGSQDGPAVLLIETRPVVLSDDADTADDDDPRGWQG